MPTLYQDPRSGNCYKCTLTAAHLGKPLRTVNIDVMSGMTRQQAFLARNPNGRVPTLELDNGVCLPESNAIIWYLAEGSTLIPTDPLERAQMLQWMFFEQYSHEPNIATVRHWISHGIEITPLRAQLIEHKRPQGYAALGVMETHLATRTYFVGTRPTVADIALYAYTHVAEEGGFALAPYPNVRAWLDRVAADAPHIKITD